MDQDSKRFPPFWVEGPGSGHCHQQVGHLAKFVLESGDSDFPACHVTVHCGGSGGGGGIRCGSGGIGGSGGGGSGGDGGCVSGGGGGGSGGSFA